MTSSASAQSRILGVIPARWGSTRFPGKPLHLIAGKSLIQRVWDQCRRCSALDETIVATDDERIRQAVIDFGGKAILTSSEHESGTDRIAEVARKKPEFAHILNIQGDEPLISPRLIGQLARKLRSDGDCPMVTAANPMEHDDPALDDPNVVKVVTDRHGRALYFSRSRIPFPRGGDSALPTLLRHKGIYGFQRRFLLQFVRWEPSPLERCEQLEQLRTLENGGSIQVLLTKDDSPGIDTPEQAAILSRQLLSE